MYSIAISIFLLAFVCSLSAIKPPLSLSPSLFHYFIQLLIPSQFPLPSRLADGNVLQAERREVGELLAKLPC